MQRLERIAEENAEYSQRVKSCFVYSNIVGIDKEEELSEYDDYDDDSYYDYDYSYDSEVDGEEVEEATISTEQVTMGSAKRS